MRPINPIKHSAFDSDTSSDEDQAEYVRRSQKRVHRGNDGPTYNYDDTYDSYQERKHKITANNRSKNIIHMKRAKKLRDLEKLKRENELDEKNVRESLSIQDKAVYVTDSFKRHQSDLKAKINDLQTNVQYQKHGNFHRKLLEMYSEDVNEDANEELGEPPKESIQQPVKPKIKLSGGLNIRKKKPKIEQQNHLQLEILLKSKVTQHDLQEYKKRYLKRKATRA